jgi:hypothetical protein
MPSRCFLKRRAAVRDGPTTSRASAGTPPFLPRSQKPAIERDVDEHHVARREFQLERGPAVGADFLDPSAEDPRLDFAEVSGQRESIKGHG